LGTVGVGATDTVVCADTLPPDPVAVTVNWYEATAGPPFAGRVAVIVAPPVVLVVVVGRPGMPGLADSVKLVASVEATVNESAPPVWGNVADEAVKDWITGGAMLLSCSPG
jgi:hypothetical protein